MSAYVCSSIFFVLAEEENGTKPRLVAPSGKRLRGKDKYGEFAVEQLCDPYLSASEVNFS